MPIEFGIWRINGEVVQVASEPLPDESRLEAILEKDMSVLGLDILLVVGRQVLTRFGKRIDLLAIDSEGTLYAIELKRDKTPRDVVAQALDYGSWVAHLNRQDISSIFASYRPAQSLDEAFLEQFGIQFTDELVGGHRLVIVASMLDSSTERIVQYLADYNVPINVVFFRYFKDGETEYLARSWLIDPADVEARASETSSRGPRVTRVTGTWNGQDYYVVRYGFVSGGQGRWFSRTLQILSLGARVFVHIPQRGFVGVGTVRETAVPVRDFMVDVNGQQGPILASAELQAPNMSDNKDDLDMSEYLVRIDWQRTVPRDQAFWEPGLFANQNTACRLRDENTIRRVSAAFRLDEA